MAVKTAYWIFSSGFQYSVAAPGQHSDDVIAALVAVKVVKLLEVVKCFNSIKLAGLGLITQVYLAAFALAGRSKGSV